MPTNCAAHNCTAIAEKGSNIKFHRIPKDEILREKWMIALSAVHYRPSVTARVCSKHFRTEDYTVDKLGRTVLKLGAVPSVSDFQADIEAGPSTSTSNAESFDEIQTGEPITPSQTFPGHIDGLDDNGNLLRTIVRNISEGPSTSISPPINDSTSNAGSFVEIQTEEQTLPSILPFQVEVDENCNLPRTYIGNPSDISFPSNVPATWNLQTTVIPDEETQEVESGLQNVPFTSQGEQSLAVLDGSSTDAALHSRTLITQRKRSVPVYVGDFVESDLECPIKRKRYWQMSQSVIRELRRTNKCNSNKMQRLRKKVTGLHELLDDLKKRFQVSSESSLVLKECVGEAEKQLLSRQLKGGSGKFPPELRSFALTLNFYSNSAYNYIRRTFGPNALPHPRTLSKWCCSVDGSPGYTSEAIRAVKIKVDIEKTKGKSLIAGLVMDEMSIKEHVEWTGTRNVGYINFGTGIQDSDNIPRAKNALVFMLVALNANWKVPIAYFLIDTLSAEEKANLVRGCLLQMESTGVVIKTLTFDGLTSNLSMCTNLGADLSWPNIRPYFLHPTTKHKIYVILDPCHMVKLCRNTLGDWGFFYDGSNRKISWNYFAELVKLQNESGLHAATKIRNRHLNFQKEKMRVKLAVQIFSASVADALEYCDKDLSLPQFSGSEALVNFCRKINDTFDILNSRNFLTKVIMKKPLCSSNESVIKETIASSIKYLSTLKDQRGNLIISSPRKTGFLGLIICLTSIGNLYDDLIKSKTLKFLCTYKLSQDHIEMFFSLMRSRGGFNNNPTALQFEASYKRVLIHTELHSPETANCLAQDETSILNVTSATNHCSRNSLDTLDLEDIEDEDFDYMVPFTEISNTMYYTDIVGYIAGFVSRKVMKQIDCDICARSLTSSNISSALLRRKNRGGLCRPSPDVVKICIVAESIMRTIKNFSEPNIMMKMMTLSLRKIDFSDVFRDLAEHILDQDPLCGHLLQLVKLVLKNYHTIRLHHINNTSNEVESRIRQKLTKLIHFNHQ